MKNMSKEEVMKRVSLYKGCKVMKLNNNPRFNRVFQMTIPGKPISDSRPRDAQGGHKYNPHKVSLMKVFEALKKKDPALRKVFIKYDHFIIIKAYIGFSKNLMKYLNANELEMLENETLPSIYMQDVDNYEKVHYDVLQDYANQIIMDDHFVTDNRTSKVYVPKGQNRERVEIQILFNSDESTVPEYVKSKALNSAPYIQYKLGWKERAINGTKFDINYCENVTKTFIDFLCDPKFKTKKRTIKNRMLSIIDTWSKEELIMYYNFMQVKPANTKVTLVKSVLQNKISQRFNQLYKEYS